MKAILLAMLPLAGFGFEKIALVDHLDYGAHFNVETREGCRQALDHVLETGCDSVWWRVMSGAVPRYHSAEEPSARTIPPFDLLRTPISSLGGWISCDRSEEDLFASVFRDFSAEYRLGFGAHWTTEEAHWNDWSCGAWNFDHPEYWCYNEKLTPFPGKCSLAYPEVLAHKLRLVDEILATGVETVFLDTCRFSGWTPGREFVKPNVEKWRTLYNCEPPYARAKQDERWLKLVAENEMRFLREIRRRCDAFSPRRKLVLGIEEAGRSEKDGGDFLWHERALDWRQLAKEGTVDALAVISARAEAADTWGSLRRTYAEIVAAKGSAKVYFPVRMYDFWKTSHGIPTYMKQTGLSAVECGKKLLDLAREAGGDGIIMGCVDYGNYPKELRELIRKYPDRPDAGMRESSFRGEKSVVISNRHGSVEATLKGAQIRSLVLGGEELLFNPKDTAFKGTDDNRGGIPVCWPWFGRNGEEGSLSHGYARYSEFRLLKSEVKGDVVSVTLRLEPSAGADAAKRVPSTCRLDYTIELGRNLNIRMKTENLGREDAWITEGLHPYWKVSDRRQVKVLGLDGMPYCFADETIEVQGKWKGEFLPDRHFDHVFWREGKGAEIVDAAAGRTLRIFGSGYNKYVIWTPPEFKFGEFENLEPADMWNFLCVEPATLFRKDGYALKPGETHETTVTVSKF